MTVMRNACFAVLLAWALAGATAFAQSKSTKATNTDWKSNTPYRDTLVPRDTTPYRSTMVPRGKPSHRPAQPPASTEPKRPSDDCPPRSVTIVTVYAPVYDSTAAIYAYEESQAYYQPGYDWGEGLKSYTFAWADFIPYLQRYLVNASPIAQDAFRRGFIAGYGTSAEATYSSAWRRACQRS
jgi:hypothetical protein